MEGSANGNGGRDAKGKFVPGNRLSLGHRGAGGRPRAIEKEHEAEYLEAMRKVLSMDDWMAIVAKQVQRALNGNLDSAKWLAAYAIGQPRQAVEMQVDALARLDVYTEEVRKMLE